MWFILLEDGSGDFTTEDATGVWLWDLFLAQVMFFA
jgi:hypothetical protein